MADMHFQSDKEMSSRTGAAVASLIEAAKPYLVAILMVTMLLSVWVSLCAADARA